MAPTRIRAVIQDARYGPTHKRAATVSHRSPLQAVAFPGQTSGTKSSESVSVQSVGGHKGCASKCGRVQREDAEALYEQGREAVVAVLLRMDEQIGRLEK